tara:strand:+ start:575 stop:778 length:204 start_codon:yes stop_codon:yes gene_type:complete
MHDLRIPSKQVLVTLPVELHKKLSIFCIKNELKKSAFMRRAIEEKLNGVRFLEDDVQYEIEVDKLTS